MSSRFLKMVTSDTGLALAGAVLVVLVIALAR